MRSLKRSRSVWLCLKAKNLKRRLRRTVELPPSIPDISLRNNVVGEGKPFNVDVVVSNPFDKP